MFSLDDMTFDELGSVDDEYEPEESASHVVREDILTRQLREHHRENAAFWYRETRKELKHARELLAIDDSPETMVIVIGALHHASAARDRARTARKLAQVLA